MEPGKNLMYGRTLAGVAVPLQVSSSGALSVGGGGQLPNIFNLAIAAAAGDTVVWTPAAGKKFNLMGYQISIAGTLAATDVLRVQVNDGSPVFSNISIHCATLTITTPTGDTQIGVDYNGGFFTSHAANSVLAVNLSAAILDANGGVFIQTWGFES